MSSFRAPLVNTSQAILFVETAGQLEDGTVITLPEHSEDTSALDEYVKRIADHVGGEDGEIDAFELRSLFSTIFQKELAGQAFGSEASRTLVAMEDFDRNGKLDYSEFRGVWRSVYEDWRPVISEAMIAPDFREVGFKLSKPALESLALRYTDENGRVSMNDFIVVCSRIKSAYPARPAELTP